MHFQTKANVLGLWQSILLALLTLLSTTISATPGRSTPNLATPQKEIETSLWNSSDSKLSELEPQIAGIIQNEPKSLLGHFYYVRFLFRQYLAQPFENDNLETINKLILHTHSLAPNHEISYLLKAEFLDLTGESQKAINLIGEIIKDNTIEKSWRTYFDHARYQAGLGDDKETLKRYHFALTQKDALPSIILPHIIAQLKISFFGKALLAELQKLAKIQNHEEVIMAIAQSETELGRYQSAFNNYEKVLQGNSDNYEALVSSSLLQINHLNKEKQGIDRLTLFTHLNSNKRDEQTLSIANFYLGSHLLKGKQPTLAKSYFLSSLKRSSDLESMVMEIAQIYQKYKKNRELAEFLLLVSEEIPGNAVIFGLLGQLSSEKFANQTQAIGYFRNAVILDPEKSDYYNGIGIAYYHLKSFDKALVAFQLALEINPEDALAHYNEACLLAKLGKKNEALASLTKAIALDPSLSTSASVDADFSDLRSQTNFSDMISSHQQQLESTSDVSSINSLPINDEESLSNEAKLSH